MALTVLEWRFLVVPRKPKQTPIHSSRGSLGSELGASHRLESPLGDLTKH